MIDITELIEELELIELAAEVALMNIEMNGEQMAKAIQKLAQQAIVRLNDENGTQQAAGA